MPKKKKSNMVLITLWIPRRQLEELKGLCEKGWFANKSDAIRYAIMQLIINYKKIENFIEPCSGP